MQGATAKINAYLKSREGKTLSPRSWSPVPPEDSHEPRGVRWHRPGAEPVERWERRVPDLKMPIDREMYATLLKTSAARMCRAGSTPS